jgi:hypothetical protein
VCARRVSNERDIERFKAKVNQVEIPRKQVLQRSWESSVCGYALAVVDSWKGGQCKSERYDEKARAYIPRTRCWLAVQK